VRRARRQRADDRFPLEDCLGAFDALDAATHLATKGLNGPLNYAPSEKTHHSAASAPQW
jgi:hypothetical protein